MTERIPQSFVVTWNDTPTTYRLEKEMIVGGKRVGRYTQQTGNGRVKKARMISSYQMEELISYAEQIQY